MNDQTNPARFAVIDRPAKFVLASRDYAADRYYDQVIVIDLVTGRELSFTVATAARLERTIEALRTPENDRTEDEWSALRRQIVNALLMDPATPDPILSYQDEEAVSFANQYRQFIENAGGHQAGQYLADMINRASASLRAAIEAKIPNMDPDAYAAHQEREAEEMAARQEAAREEDDRIDNTPCGIPGYEEMTWREYRETDSYREG
jgi:hypothetical protein